MRRIVLAAGRVVGIRPGQLVDVRAVQVDLAGGVARQPAEVALELGERAVDVDARVLGVVALPDRDRRAPVAVAADRPVARALEPLAELPVLDVLGHPGDLLVELDQAVAELGDAHEPARDRLVDERVAAAPAVRVGVLVAREAQQAPVLPQDAHERLVRVDPQLARDIGHRGQEAPAVVEARGSSGMPAASATRWSSSP